MSEVDSEHEKFKKDSRILCRYGEKCYQKNPAHFSKYKHPPKNAKRKNNDIQKPTKAKQIKLDEIFKKEHTGSSDLNSFENQAATDAINAQLSRRECLSPSNSESEENCEFSIEMDNVNEQTCKLLTRNKTEEINSDAVNSEVETEPSSSTPFDTEKFIKSRFLVEPPKDFYDFWEFCKELKPTNPADALKDVGLKLVGPYDVLAGKFKHVKKPSEEYLLHWRYYYDPPEVLTVIKGDDQTGYHIGYFYDSPTKPPSLLVSNYGTKDGVFSKLGDNIFCAVCFYIEELRTNADPFKKMHSGKYLKLIKTKAEKLNLNLSLHSKQQERDKKVITKTINKIGLVVPYDKKTQLGYRELAMEEKQLMSLLSKIDKASPEQRSRFLSDLQPVLTYANIALDECDFGTGVKLGWDLLYHGTDILNGTISKFLSNSYKLLNKEPFAKIAEAHMNKRKKGCNLSII